MSFYSNLAGTAQRLLTQFGQDVTLRRSSAVADAYDDSTGQVTVTPPVSTVWKGALFDFKMGTVQVNGILVEATDKQLLIEAGAAPTVDDAIVAGGVEWSVVSVRQVNPAGTPVIYSLHLRK